LARKWQPPGVSSDLWYSRRMVEAAGRSQRIIEGAGALRLAVAAAERATTNAEDLHNAFYNLASIQAAMNNPAKVESNLRLAIAVAQTGSNLIGHWRGSGSRRRRTGRSRGGTNMDPMAAYIELLSTSAIDQSTDLHKSLADSPFRL
jgi:hypothetical protein